MPLQGVPTKTYVTQPLSVRQRVRLAHSPLARTANMHCECNGDLTTVMAVNRGDWHVTIGQRETVQRCVGWYREVPR